MAYDAVAHNSDKAQAALKPAAKAETEPGPRLARLPTRCEIYVPGWAASHIKDMKSVTKPTAPVGQP